MSKKIGRRTIEKIKELYFKGWSINKIALYTSISTTITITILKKMGYDTSKYRYWKGVHKKTINDILKYQRKGLVLYAIAGKLGKSEVSIRNIMKTYATEEQREEYELLKKFNARGVSPRVKKEAVNDIKEALYNINLSLTGSQYNEESSNNVRKQLRAYYGLVFKFEVSEGTLFMIYPNLVLILGLDNVLKVHGILSKKLEFVKQKTRIPRGTNTIAVVRIKKGEPIVEYYHKHKAPVIHYASADLTTFVLGMKYRYALFKTYHVMNTLELALLLKEIKKTGIIFKMDDTNDNLVISRVL